MIRIEKKDYKSYRLLDPEKDFRYNMDSAVAFSLEPSLTEDFEDVLYFGEAFIDPTTSAIRPQWVYCLVNSSIAGVVKIGMTTTSVIQRSKEISAATGVITPWYPVYSLKVGNAYLLEQEVHRYLEDRGCRLNPRREGFEITSKQAIAVIKELSKKYLTNEGL